MHSNYLLLLYVSKLSTCSCNNYITELLGTKKLLKQISNISYDYGETITSIELNQ